MDNLDKLNFRKTTLHKQRSRMYTKAPPTHVKASDEHTGTKSYANTRTHTQTHLRAQTAGMRKHEAGVQSVAYLAGRDLRCAAACCGLQPSS